MLSDDKVCKNCESDNLKKNDKIYTLRCKKCDTRISITNGTIFHNVRFGLLKAFRIVFKYHKNNFSLSSVEVSKEFDITQKTAWKFLNKINKNKEEVSEFINKAMNIKTEKKMYNPKQDDMDKLKRFIGKF